MKRIAVLGSTGSIGRATLDVVDAFPGRFEIVALGAGRNLECLREQIRRHRPACVSVARSDDLRDLEEEFHDTTFFSGADGLEAVAGQTDAEMVVVAVVGAAGLLPTLAAIRAGKDVALANKETLVVAGGLVMEAVRAAGVRLLPVDSEHSAVHQLLGGHTADAVRRLTLTASGGPFRRWPREAMKSATVEDALDHPTWRMGAKITVDSATMMNKGFEIIEAHHLFGVPEDEIDVVIHPQSRVHALVELIDGSIIAHMSRADMRLAITYALAWPERLTETTPAVDVAGLPDLTFAAPDLERFPALELSRSALRAGGEMPAVLNAANEVAVASFLEGRCSYPSVAATVAATLDRWAPRNRPLMSIEQALAADCAARRLAAEYLMKYGAPVSGSEIRC